MSIAPRIHLAVLLLASSALAGCSSGGGNAANVADLGNAVTEVITGNESLASPTNATASGVAETVGGDGSQIILSPLSPAEIADARLEGELGCSFSTAVGTAPLLIAKGNTGPQAQSFGVVKVGTYVEAVSAPGGFNAMVRGVTFSGKGKSIRIAPTGERAIDGGESPPIVSTMTYDRMDGAKRVIEGLWTCGP